MNVNLGPRVSQEVQIQGRFLRVEKRCSRLGRFINDVTREKLSIFRINHRIQESRWN